MNPYEPLGGGSSEHVIGSLPSVDEFSARVALLAVDAAVAEQLRIRADLIRAEAAGCPVPDFRLGMLRAAAMLEGGNTDD
jgi:hypothetical protein